MSALIGGWLGYRFGWTALAIGIVLVAVLASMAPHDVSNPAPVSAITGNPCGSFGRVVSATLVSTGSNIYRVTCSMPTNPGQPPAQIVMEVAQ